MKWLLIKCDEYVINIFQGLVANMNVDIMKMPRGVMKILQFVSTGEILKQNKYSI